MCSDICLTLSRAFLWVLVSSGSWRCSVEPYEKANEFFPKRIHQNSHSLWWHPKKKKDGQKLYIKKKIQVVGGGVKEKKKGTKGNEGWTDLKRGERRD